MTDTPPKPNRRSWRWVAAAVIGFLLSVHLLVWNLTRSAGQSPLTFEDLMLKIGVYEARP